MTSTPYTAPSGGRYKRQADAMRLEFLKLKLRAAEFLIEVQSGIKAEAFDRADQVDLGWCFREIEKMCDELRKEFKSRKELIGKVLALRIAEEAMNDMGSLSGEKSMTVHGEFASGIPDVSQSASLPRPDTADYVALCKYLGIIDEDLVGSGVVRFSYTSLSDLVTRLAAEGKPLPDGIAKTYSVYSTIFRTKKRERKIEDVNEEN